MRIRSALQVAACLALAACGGAEEVERTNASATSNMVEPAEEAGVSSEGPAANDVVPATLPAAAPQRRVQTSRLEGCRVVVDRPDEAGYRVSECAAPGGFVVRLSEADGRQNLLVKAPGKDFVSLRLSELNGGAFSRIDPAIEWHGAEAGVEFVPDSLILRYLSADDPAQPDRDTPYLIAVRLTGPAPCMVAQVRPGTAQQIEARRIADSDTACLSR